jgi:hypothetical protein
MTADVFQNTLRDFFAFRLEFSGSQVTQVRAEPRVWDLGLVDMNHEVEQDACST